MIICEFVQIRSQSVIRSQERLEIRTFHLHINIDRISHFRFVREIWSMTMHFFPEPVYYLLLSNRCFYFSIISQSVQSQSNLVVGTVPICKWYHHFKWSYHLFFAYHLDHICKFVRWKVEGLLGESAYIN